MREGGREVPTCPPTGALKMRGIRITRFLVELREGSDLYSLIRYPTAPERPCAQRNYCVCKSRLVNHHMYIAQF